MLPAPWLWPFPPRLSPVPSPLTAPTSCEQSNEQNKLVRTEYKNVEYKTINLEKLGVYLSSNKVNLVDEDSLDFPLSIYNIHQGMITVIKNLFK